MFSNFWLPEIRLIMKGRQKAIKVVAPAWSPGVPINKSTVKPKANPKTKSCHLGVLNGNNMMKMR